MEKSESTQLHEDLVKISQFKQGYGSLIQLIQNLMGELELDILLNRISKEFKKLYNTEACIVLLYDKKKKEFWAKNIENNNEEIRIPIEDNIIREVFQSGRIWHIKNTKKESNLYQEYNKKIKFDSGSILSIPLKNKSGIVFGIFQLLSKKHNFFSDKDEELLISIEPIISSAIINAQYNMEYKKSLASFIDMISSTLDKRDYIMAGHSRRVTQYAIEIGKKIKLDSKQMEILKYAGLLHDIGKIGVPETVLFKDRKLSEEEYDILKQHADLTESILKEVHFFADFKTIPEIASAHHEKLDGSGYPAGLKGDQILLGSRILAVADVFDALTSRRQFRDRMPLEEVIKTLDDETGSSFDPFIVYNFKLIELDRLIQILEYGFTDTINKKDLLKINTHTLKDMIEIRAKTNKNEQEIEIENIFMGYYLRRQKKDLV